MNAPAILKGTPHLPLTESMVSDEAIKLANSFYQTSLSVEDFQQSQAFLNSNQQLSLELLDKDTGDVIVTFVNQSAPSTTTVVDGAGVPAVFEWNLANPIFDARQYTPWMAPPVQLHSSEEVVFLDALGEGMTAPIITSDNTLAFKLSTLLNSYQVLGRWVSGTLGEQATGGFRLVYKGHSLDAPDGFLLDYSPLVVIIEILEGNQKGFLCLTT